MTRACARFRRSEVGVLVHTALLSRCVRHAESADLLRELALFLLGGDTHREQPTPAHARALRYHLIKHCDHISDEVSDNLMATQGSSVMR